ncbi:MAG: hypothetical protein MK135_02520 [Polyangiaceae bacterium]|nr:hypothetical protein [Polyangiaceae bacterium]
MFLVAVLAFASCKKEPEPQSSVLSHGEGKPSDSKTSRAKSVPWGPSPAEGQLRMVGSSQCKSCHAEIFDAYQSSDHGRSLTRPEESTFCEGCSERLPFLGEQVRAEAFLKSLEIKTKGEGQSRKILWQIGHQPLFQFVVEGNGGRQQVHPGAVQGVKNGQEAWVLSHGDVPLSDELHYLGPAGNFNQMCANCHMTNYLLGYELEKDRYRSSFAEDRVNCEACHGPASAHLSEVEFGRRTEFFGFARSLKVPASRRWARGPDERIAHLEGGGPSSEEDTCAACHSRRTDFGRKDAQFANRLDLSKVRDLSELQLSSPEPSQAVFESYDSRYRLATLDESLYFVDGQIKDEVFVWGSFKQSKMHQAGVLCGDCHDPHSGLLKAPIESVCFQCHEEKSFNSLSHHQHEAPAPLCVDCHMPSRTYMDADPRRDHGFSIPNPALHRDKGTPLACTNCHQDKDAAFFVDALQEKAEPSSRGDRERPRVKAHRVLSDVRQGKVPASRLAPFLSQGPLSLALPTILRATFITEWALRAVPGAAEGAPLAMVIAQSARSPETELRVAAAEALPVVPEASRQELAALLLADDSRSVRIATFYSLARWPQLPARLSEAMNNAGLEAARGQLAQGGRLETLLGLAEVFRYFRNAEMVRKSLELAVERFPAREAAWTNLADAYRELGESKRSLSTLQEARRRFPKDGGIAHALGLAEIRTGDQRSALGNLKFAFEHAEQSQRARFGYVYAIALYEKGAALDAQRLAQLLREEFPHDREISSLGLLQRRLRPAQSSPAQARPAQGRP